MVCSAAAICSSDRLIVPVFARNLLVINESDDKQSFKNSLNFDYNMLLIALKWLIVLPFNSV